MAGAVQWAATTAPEAEVGSVVVPGEPLTVLEAESREAEPDVVGSRNGTRNGTGS
ncbi:hypothetical protein [Streptomyces spongiicola]|uniref:hypothetical protein n=1 Tax=Streptomyces spongiicola TaxID=1690221 RepID=UPI0035A5BDB0